MKANKKTLMAVKDFFENRDGWDLDELINEVAHETQLLKHPDLKNHTLSMDECGVEWNKDTVCVLDDFVDKYTRIFLRKVCNVIDSFVGEDI